MKTINDYINEAKGLNVDEQWINDEKPVMTNDGRQVIVLKLDISKVPNLIIGNVKMKEKLFEYKWELNGKCVFALDNLGNPKRPTISDNLVKAIV